MNITALKREIRRFIKSKHYEIVLYPYRESMHHRTVPYTADLSRALKIPLPTAPNMVISIPQPVVDEVGVRIHIRKQHPAARIGAIVGDIVHDLRSALDHVVWALSEHYSGAAPPDPIPKRSPWRYNGLPHTIDPPHWKSAQGQALGGIDPAL
ncbi:MAG: hypothetical protein AAB037_00805, partial [Chloroflexota bacterium]